MQHDRRNLSPTEDFNKANWPYIGLATRAVASIALSSEEPG